MKKISILGAGSWGTALAHILSIKGHAVTLICRDQKTAEAINENHRHPKYLSSTQLSDSLIARADYKSLATAEVILLVLPTVAIESVLTELTSHIIAPNAVWVSCSKGIDRKTGSRMSEVVSRFFPQHQVAVLSGPNHAEEVAQSLPSCVVIGSECATLSAELQTVFNAPNFRCYSHDDLAGIELGGAIKNVFAIAAGIAAGLGLGDNSIAALVTRGLAEMTRLGSALGGRPETFTGLSGVGDLIVTCFSKHSRNNQLGRALGEGQSLDEAVKKVGMVVEGVPNTLSIYEAAQNAGVRTPLIDAVYHILYEGKPAQEALKELFARDLRPETDQAL